MIERVSEVIDVNKTSKWKECDFCHCCYFLDKGFKFQSYVHNGVVIYLWCLWTVTILQFKTLAILVIYALLGELAKVK